VVEAQFGNTVFGQRRNFVQQLIDTRQAIINRMPHGQADGKSIAAVEALETLLDEVQPGWKNTQSAPTHGSKSALS